MSAPAISVVMVTHGAWEWTERALSALAEHTPAELETIVVDNASPDGTAERVRERFPAVRLIVNEHNAGFGPATNQGAALATAPLLLLLNSDAVVGPGWLEPLTGELAHPQVGAVVPMLLHPDGRAQDAGGLLGRDGTAASYGDGGDPEDPALGFPRTIDYGSGACLLLRRAAFEAAGGFDDEYAPAYYEDADLCMALASRGLVTRYAPASRVVHARYASGDRERAEALSSRNRATFAARWGERLVGRPPTLSTASPEALLCARDAPATARVLLAGQAPAPESPAGQALAGLLRERPEIRLTLLGGRTDGWAQLGAEVADPADEERARWLERRRFHYDLLLGEPPRDVIDTQPQAGRAPAPADAAAVPRMLAAAGVAR